MLRAILLVFAVLLLVFSGWLVTFDVAGWPMLVFPILLLIGIVFERVHYTGNARANEPDKDWAPTSERFLDEATGRPVTVWFNATTGERKYVDE